MPKGSLLYSLCGFHISVMPSLLLLCVRRRRRKVRSLSPMRDAVTAASFRESPIAAAAERASFEEEGGVDCTAFDFPTAASREQAGVVQHAARLVQRGGRRRERRCAPSRLSRVQRKRQTRTRARKRSKSRCHVQVLCSITCW